MRLCSISNLYQDGPEALSRPVHFSQGDAPKDWVLAALERLLLNGEVGSVSPFKTYGRGEIDLNLSRPCSHPEGAIMGGPFVKETGSLSGNSYTRRIWRTQAKPYIKPLPYQYSAAVTDVGNSPCSAYQVLARPADLGLARSQLVNRLLENLRDQVSSTASVGVTAAEYPSARDMIVRRATQVAKAVRQIRKGKFGKAARTLGVTQPKGASRKKQFADNFLEYSFGWSPLIGDMFDAAKVFASEVPRRVFRVRGKYSDAIRLGQYPRPDPGRSGTVETFDCAVAFRVHVRVSNPNVHLANQLGLLNPASVAWELVPFSFVVDWFTGFGSYLDSLTFGLGLILEDASTTDKCSYTKKMSIANGSSDWLLYEGRSFAIERVLGLPSATPTPPPFEGFSVRRGITAISLIIQSMR